MRASTQSVTQTSWSGSSARTVSRSSVAWCPDSGATSNTRGSLRFWLIARRKCTSLQKGLSSSVTASTATGLPSMVVVSIFQAGFA